MQASLSPVTEAPSTGLPTYNKPNPLQSKRPSQTTLNEVKNEARLKMKIAQFTDREIDDRNDKAIQTYQQTGLHLTSAEMLAYAKDLQTNPNSKKPTWHK